MGYTAYELDKSTRQAILAAFPPRYARAMARHITVAFGAVASGPLPSAADLEIVGRVDDKRGIEALVVSVNGSTQRPDGETYHLTLSYNPAKKPWKKIDADESVKGYRSHHSNALIKAYGYKALPPVTLKAMPSYLLTREEKTLAPTEP